MRGDYIGIVTGEASTDEFSFVFSPEVRRGLKNVYVVVESKGVKVVGRVIEITTDNPLLSAENMKFFVDEKIGSKVGDFFKSNRFTNYTAKCEVLGKFNQERGTIEPLTEPVETGSKVFLIDKELLESLFFSPSPTELFPGYIEQMREARFSLRGDEILTMHCGIFGMTGMGKTTTTGTLLEELTIRGAKSLIFDPHGDYRRLGVLRRELYESVRSEAEDPSKPLGRLVEEVRGFLEGRWRELPLEELPPGFREPLLEEIEEELTTSSICFRLSLLFSLLKGEVVNSLSPSAFRSQLLSWAQEFDFQAVRERVPEDILTRILKLVIEGFPALKLNSFFNKYFVMNLIEAYSGEEITEAQQEHFIRWLDEAEELEGEELIDYLLSKLPSMGTSKSKGAIRRKLEKCKMVLESLVDSSLIPVDSYRVILDFSRRNGSLFPVSNLIFDLTRVSPETVQRALLYSVAYSGFHLHKSRELSFHRGDSSLLFVIEEARSLIPRSGAEDIDHPASKFARNIIRRIATEGRKMALGLLIISQKPSSVDPLPVSQCNTLILHRVVNPEDLSFVKSVGEEISEEDIETLKRVERGVSIVSGTALKLRKSLLVRFRPRLSEEGREHPRPLGRLWPTGS